MGEGWRRKVHRPTPLAALYGALFLLLAASIATYAIDRRTSWANNWLPNFIAEWSGILLALLVFDRLKEAQQRRAFEQFVRPARERAGLALGQALKPMIEFLLALAESTGLNTKPGEDLVPFMDELYNWIGSPHEDIVDPPSCLADWARTLALVETRLRAVHTNYDTVLDPEALAEIDSLADTLANRQFVEECVGKRMGQEITSLISPHLYQSLSPLSVLSFYFANMVGVPSLPGRGTFPRRSTRRGGRCRRSGSGSARMSAARFSGPTTYSHCQRRPPRPLPEANRERAPQIAAVSSRRSTGRRAMPRHLRARRPPPR